MKKEKEEVKGLVGLDGKEVQSTTPVIDYSDIKISDVFKPTNYAIVVEEPNGFSKMLSSIRTEADKEKIQDADQVYTVVAVGEDVTRCKIGDMVMLHGGQMKPINLVSDTQFEINEDSIAGTVLKEDHEKIRRFFSKKRQEMRTKLPRKIDAYLDYEGKQQFFNPPGKDKIVN